MNTTRREFLASIATIATLSIHRWLRRPKRIKWCKGEWSGGRREWTATVRMNRSAARAFTKPQSICMNSRPYRGTKAKHLWFVACVFIGTVWSPNRTAVVSLVEFDIEKCGFYDAVSFTDLFWGVQNACS